MVHDTVIKRLVQEYQKNRTHFPEIVEHIAQYIHNYPKIVWQMDEDTSSEFFLYIFERLDKILLQYKVFECQFRTWLTVVLRMHYINWQKSSACKKESMIKYLPYLLDSYTYNISIQSNKIHAQILDKISEHIEQLPKKVSIVMKLYCIDLFESRDFFTISTVFQVPLAELLGRWSHVILELSQKSTDRQHYEQRLEGLRQYITHIEQELQKETLSEHKKQALTQKLHRHHKTARSFTKKLRKNEHLKSSIIASFLGIPTNQAHTLVYRGKLILQQCLRSFI